MAIYPFMDGNVIDFEPIFTKIGDMRPPYDFDAYASAFFPTAESLTREAEAAERSGNKGKARELFLRAAAVYRISRFPVPRSDKQKQAWELNKDVYLKGARLLEPPIDIVKIPHVHALPRSAEEGSELSIFVRRPDNANGPVPVVITIFGLDGYRTEGTPNSDYPISRGWAYVSVEIPGTGDNPSLPQDPKSPERCWTTLLDWLQGQAWVDEKKIVAWGLSTGGYYAMRIAHTHADRLLGVVAQGGGSHHMFDSEWLSKAGNLEYPFDLDHSLCAKFGYKSMEEMRSDAQKKFSLLQNGIFDMPCTRLLLLNGINDSIFPIEDSMLALEHGDVKEARFFSGAHMGEPGATKTAHRWIDKLIASS